MTDISPPTTAGPAWETAQPSWFDDVVARVAVSAQIVLAGAVEDLQVFGNGPGVRPSTLTLEQAVGRALAAAGLDLVVAWDLVNGVRAVLDRRADAAQGPSAPRSDDGAADDSLASLVLGAQWRRPATSVSQSLRDLAQILQLVVRSQDVRVGLVLVGASRLVQAPGVDNDLFRLHLIAHELVTNALPRATPGGRRLFNPVVWLVDREADLPHWLLTAPKARVITVPAPVLAARETAARALVPSLPGGEDLLRDPGAVERVVTAFAEESEGLTVHDMRAAAQLARDRGIDASDVREAVRFLRSGHRVSPWRDPTLRQRIADAESTLGKAVRGQDAAVRKAAEILARSALGLSGAHSASHPSRPQGLLFLAGPTGVGKTELAKQIARLVFGRPDALVRFDMSEFGSEHTEARLLGSPPGYVGHEAGGELTNAVRDKPFSVLLFDEIDKADARILDKFLQILEDGRLTDGAGSTVHFGESLIIFTSNEGTMITGPTGDVPIPLNTPPDELERRIREAIENKFVKVLKRPELLNRIGRKNIIVFQYLTPPVAREIADRDLGGVVNRVREVTSIDVAVTESARATVHDTVTEERVLVDGGRGVGNEIEEIIVNPLARWSIRNPSATVAEIDADGDQLTFDVPRGER